MELSTSGEKVRKTLLPKPDRCFCYISLKFGIFAMAVINLIIHISCFLVLVLRVLTWSEIYDLKIKGKLNITNVEILEQSHNFFPVFAIRVASSSTSMSHIIMTLMLFRGMIKTDFTLVKSFFVVEAFLLHLEVYSKIYSLTVSSTHAFMEAPFVYTTLLTLLIYFVLGHYMLLIINSYISKTYEKTRKQIEIPGKIKSELLQQETTKHILSN